MSQSIQGRTALVTGANRGIGKAIVEALLESGAAKVYAGARRPESLEDLVARFGDRVTPVRLDVTDADQVASAASTATDVDLLINNAGVVEHGNVGFEDVAWADAARREFEVNTIGPLKLTQALAPTLAANGGGTVVNVISIAGLVNFPVFMTYSLSKAATHSLTQASRIFLSGQGTKVVGVYPGPVDTDMATELEMEKESPRAVADRILAGIAAGREEVYPDAMAEQFGAAYESNPKELERQVSQGAEEPVAA